MKNLDYKSAQKGIKIFCSAIMHNIFLSTERKMKKKIFIHIFIMCIYDDDMKCRCECVGEFTFCALACVLVVPLTCSITHTQAEVERKREEKNTAVCANVCSAQALEEKYLIIQLSMCKCKSGCVFTNTLTLYVLLLCTGKNLFFSSSSLSKK